MNHVLGDFRLIPLVLFAAVCLLLLKSTGLIFDGGFTLGERLSKTETMTVTTVKASPSIPMRSPSSALAAAPSGAQEPKVSWMREMFNYPDVTGSIAKVGETAQDAAIVTGSAAASKPAVKPEAAKLPETKPPETKPVDGTLVQMEPSPSISKSERAIIERLQQRRQELDARAKEFELRESLLKAAEQKLDARNNDLKALEAKLVATTKRDEAETMRYKSIVTMYENMKPKEAAKIFDRLDMRVLLEVASTMNPRRMSEILAQMSPEAAEKLTVELAARTGDKSSANSDLPKIEGRPTGG